MRTFRGRVLDGNGTFVGTGLVVDDDGKLADIVGATYAGQSGLAEQGVLYRMAQQHNQQHVERSELAHRALA